MFECLWSLVCRHSGQLCLSSSLGGLALLAVVLSLGVMSVEAQLHYEMRFPYAFLHGNSEGESSCWQTCLFQANS